MSYVLTVKMRMIRKVLPDLCVTDPAYNEIRKNGFEQGFLFPSFVCIPQKLEVRYGKLSIMFSVFSFRVGDVLYGA